MVTSNMNEDSSMETDKLSGCNMVNRMWEVAKECNIDNPGISGTSGRVMSFVKCGNVAEFMNLAVQKCWEERNSTEFPPVVRTKHTHSSGRGRTNKTGSGSKTGGGGR